MFQKASFNVKNLEVKEGFLDFQCRPLQPQVFSFIYNKKYLLDLTFLHFFFYHLFWYYLCLNNNKYIFRGCCVVIVWQMTTALLYTINCTLKQKLKYRLHPACAEKNDTRNKLNLNLANYYTLVYYIYDYYAYYDYWKTHGEDCLRFA